MRRRRFLRGAGLAAAALAAGAGCDVLGPPERWRPLGTGVAVAERRPVSGVSAVRLATVGRLVVTQGEAEELTIEAESNVAPRIRTAVQGERLVISWAEERPAVFLPTRPVVVRLTVRALRGLELAAAGVIEAAGITTDRLTVRLNGAGRVRLDDLTADELDATLAGVGGLSAAGGVRREVVTINGAGRHQADRLQAASADVTLNGVGGAVVRVRDQLTVQINGTGGVLYYGNPTVTKEVAGLGEVSRVWDQ